MHYFKIINKLTYFYQKKRHRKFGDKPNCSLFHLSYTRDFRETQAKRKGVLASLPVHLQKFQSCFSKILGL